MICDALLTFADNTSLNTGAAGTYQLGDVVDMGIKPGLWATDGLYWIVTVDTTATSGGSATGQFNLITSPNADLSAPVVLASTPAFPVAQLSAGKLVIAIGVPVGAAYDRYLGMSQTTGTAAFTAGKVNGFLTTTPPVWRAFADALPTLG